MIEVIGKVRIGEEYEVMEEGGKAVCKKLRKNKSVEAIAEELEEERSMIEKVIRFQQQVGTYDVEQICEALRIGLTENC